MHLLPTSRSLSQRASAYSCGSVFICVCMVDIVRVCMVEIASVCAFVCVCVFRWFNSSPAQTVCLPLWCTPRGLQRVLCP